MDRKKKDAPKGTPIHRQDNRTTSEAERQAQALFGLIREGKENALPRPKGRADRELRRLIAEANMNGDCIINVGNGYFRPGEDDDVELETYLRAEVSRARRIRRKVSKMREAYDRRYE